MNQEMGVSVISCETSEDGTQGRHPLGGDDDEDEFIPKKNAVNPHKALNGTGMQSSDSSAILPSPSPPESAATPIASAEVTEVSEVGDESSEVEEVPSASSSALVAGSESPPQSRKRRRLKKLGSDSPGIGLASGTGPSGDPGGGGCANDAAIAAALESDEMEGYEARSGEDGEAEAETVKLSKKERHKVKKEAAAERERVRERKKKKDLRRRGAEALGKCLNVAYEMSEKLIASLGGEDEANRASIRERMSAGRCHFRRSHNLPALSESTSGVIDELKEYQRAGVHWMCELHHMDRDGILADEMGLGKTAQTCVFLNHLYRSELCPCPSVVVCPATLVDNWCGELERWAPDVRVLKYHGSQSRRRDLIEEYWDSEGNIHVLVTSFQTLVNPWDRSVFIKELDFGYLVVDEAHNLKNAESSVYKLMKNKISSSRRLLLTGSPIQNHISELSNLFLFIMPHLFDKESLELSLQSFQHIAHKRQKKKRSASDAHLSDPADDDSVSPTAASNQPSKIEGEKLTIAVNSPSDTPSGITCSTPSANEASECGTPMSCGPTPTTAASQRKAKEVHIQLLKLLGQSDEACTSPSRASSSSSSIPPHTSEKVLPVEVRCLQMLLGPFILRRLKHEVLSDLPTKHSLVELVEMKGRQLDMYQKEVQFADTDLAKALSHYSRVIAKSSVAQLGMNEEIVETVDTGVKGENEKRGMSEVSGLKHNQDKRENTGEEIKDVGEVKEINELSTANSDTCSEIKATEGDVNEKKRLMEATLSSTPSPTTSAPSPSPQLGLHSASVSPPTSNSPKPPTGTPPATSRGPPKAEGRAASQLVKHLLPRLRRICNHPLLGRGFYSPDQYETIIDIFTTKIPGFVGNSRSKVAAELSAWSDHDIHLASQQHAPLAEFAIPKEQFLDSAKVQRMIEIIKNKTEKGEKVLVFSQFTMYLNLLAEVLIFALPSVGCCRLDGDTPINERQDMVHRFQTDESVKVFLLSTRAGGTGLNLTAAKAVILMDQDWNPHNDRQAEDRVHRLGQTHEVTVHRLCCRGTVEESILKCCQRKLNLDEAFGGDTETLQAAILQNSFTLSSAVPRLPSKPQAASDTQDTPKREREEATGASPRDEASKSSICKKRRHVESRSSSKESSVKREKGSTHSKGEAKRSASSSSSTSTVSARIPKKRHPPDKSE
eukprot:GHVN01065804.1.p1 GENE.GHVN01065804.1~~GHVN01065804.1.p1  ORF type:complete len:1176 (-),score=277.64 GHVN01065804.1:6170-9697(-)